MSIQGSSRYDGVVPTWPAAETTTNLPRPSQNEDQRVITVPSNRSGEMEDIRVVIVLRPPREDDQVVPTMDDL